MESEINAEDFVNVIVVSDDENETITNNCEGI